MFWSNKSVNTVNIQTIKGLVVLDTFCVKVLFKKCQFLNDWSLEPSRTSKLLQNGLLLRSSRRVLIAEGSIQRLGPWQTKILDRLKSVKYI